MADREQRTTQKLLADASELALARLRRDMTTASPKVQPMLSYIDDHLFDPALNVAAMRKHLRLRDNSIAINFHRQVGFAPKAYMAQLRLETASRLLLNSSLQVWKIAESVGYSGLGVFSKAFNRWAGQRPNAYRRQMRGLGQSAPPEKFSPEFLQRAAAGKLSTDEAQWLLERLGLMYPEACVGAFDEEPRSRGQHRSADVWLPRVGVN